MKIQFYVLGVVSTNCYIISNENTKEAIVIDPGDHAPVIIKELKKGGLIPGTILLTHGHFDHIMAAGDLAENYHIPIFAGEAEKELLEDAGLNGSRMMGRDFVLTPSRLLKDNELLVLAGMRIKVIQTPGHTAGGVCYYFEDEKVLISGDTLFLESVGRTDLPTGDSEALIESIRRELMILPDEVAVYPGHGGRTDIGHERAYNPYLREDYFGD